MIAAGRAIARRTFLTGLSSGIAAAVLGLAAPFRGATPAAAQTLGETQAFSRGRILQLAESLAGQPFVDRREEIPEPLRALTYDAYRAIRPGAAAPFPLSEGGRFYYEPLLAGSVFNQPVELWYVRGDTAYRITYDPSGFRFDPPAAGQIPDGPLPFSGFRLRTNYLNPDVLDEFAVFQGASYFRAVGAGEIYGLSARGLALNTGHPEGEEFPVFRAFFVEEPGPDSNAVVVHALLDSPSTTGAYRITVRPGDICVTDVELTLYPRQDLPVIGFAPFSSMFLFDQVNRAGWDDYRRAVHDSDGLSIHTGGGEWLWRPLSNRETLQVSAFVDTTPRGFGLVQRKRQYTDYHDAEARYELRPTAWVEPIGEWGRGAVVLFEIPTRGEENDNIVAYWAPDRPVRAGEPFALTYRIHWDGVAIAGAQGPRVVGTRHGRNLSNSGELYVVDFAMGGRTMEGVQVHVESSGGRIQNVTSYPTPEPDTLRASFELDTDELDNIELRLSLTLPDGPPAERWLFRWTR